MSIDSELREIVRFAARECPFYQRRYFESGVDPDRIEGVKDLPGFQS